MVFQGRIEKGGVVFAAPVPLPDGTLVRVEPIAGSGFWASCSLDDLAKQQGVVMPATVDELVGGWPVDDRDDGFEEALLRWRERELDER